jgi:hypothetical protein
MATKKKSVNPVGRPKDKFIPWVNWYDDILELYSDGASDVEIRGLILDKLGRKSFCWELWDRWLKDEEEFSETIKRGRMLSQIWWESMGRKHVLMVNSPGEATTNLNYTGWYMNMKNRFGWKDKQELEHSGEVATKHIYKMPEKDK